MSRPNRLLILSPAQAGLALAGLLLLLAGPAQAQDDKRMAQMRELAKRAQQTAQQAQQDAAAQRAEVARLQAELQSHQRGLDEARKSASRDTGKVSAQLLTLQTEQTQLRSQLDSEQAAAAQARQAQAALQAQLQQAQAQLAEQRQVTASVTRLLEDSVRALEKAEAANKTLHDLALQAVQARPDPAAHGWADPVLRLSQVRQESEAELWRQRIDALRLTAAQAPR